MTRLLILDTCTERSIVLLAQDTQVVASALLPLGLANSATLMPCIERLLKEANWEPASCSAIAATAGPGSYTGMRVGAAVVQSMAYARKLPLIALCSLEGFIPEQEGLFAAVIDAKMGGAYVLTGIRHAQHTEVHFGPELVPLQQLQERLKGIHQLVTPNATRLRHLVETEGMWQERWPSAEELARLALNSYQAKAYTVDGHLPLQYLRKTQAELDLEGV